MPLILRVAAVLRASLLLPPSLRMPLLRGLVVKKALPQGCRLRVSSWVPGCHPSSIRGVGEVSSVWVPLNVLVVVRALALKGSFVPVSPIRRPNL